MKQFDRMLNVCAVRNLNKVGTNVSGNFLFMAWYISSTNGVTHYHMCASARNVSRKYHLQILHRINRVH